MERDNIFLFRDDQAVPRVMGNPRKPYTRPVLAGLGDLRTMTLGSSPTGIKDSGVGTLYEYTGSPVPPFPLPDEFKPPDDLYIPPL